MTAEMITTLTNKELYSVLIQCLIIFAFIAGGALMYFIYSSCNDIEKRGLARKKAILSMMRDIKDAQMLKTLWEMGD